MDRYIGRLLDNRYEILELIGSGGMADVYKARCNRLNRLVAIKILKDDLSKDDEFRRRFHAESQAVAMLSHPNIVSVYDVSHSDNIDYIVMELIEGISLKQYMEQKGQLGWREALHFATQIAKGLEHAHSRGIIHRDIKPHNIMILKDGSVKVADFGIAQVSSSQNTLTREALGSVHYISPEQAKGAHVDERTDIYSLGVVMYEMLTGRPPFDGDSPVSVAIQHINATPQSISRQNPSVPLGLEQITMRAMASNLNERYTSASEMLADLEEFRKNPNLFMPEFSENGAAALSDTQILSGQILERSDAQRAVLKQSGVRPQPSVKAAPAQKPDANERNKSRRAVIIGVVCIILAFAGIGLFLYNFLFSDLLAKTAEDTVPDLVGHSIEDISEEDYPNFEFEVKYWKTSTEYPSGYVIDQSPAAGRDAKIGTTMELTVSSGPDDNLMPDLTSFSLQNAKIMLSNLSVSVVVDVVYEQSDLVTDGYVIRTNPAADAPLQNDQTVTLYVSKGQADKLVTVPDVVGKDYQIAIQLLEDAELTIGNIDWDKNSTEPKDTVISQSRDPDENIKAGSAIDLKVSQGKKEEVQASIVDQSQNSTVSAGTPVSLYVNAVSEVDSILTYEWYQTKGSTRGGTLVSGESGESTYAFVPDSEGTYYFYCKVFNNYEQTTSVTYSSLICITVTGNAREKAARVINVVLPAGSNSYQISVYVDGEVNGAPFTVDNQGGQGGGISLSVEGTGNQKVDVYADSMLIFSQYVDFS